MGNWKITDYAEHFRLVLTKEHIRFPPSLTYAKIPSRTSLVIIYILFYLILLILEN